MHISVPGKLAVARYGVGNNRHVVNVTNPGLNKDIQPALQAAIDGAENGDEIRLPEGRFSVCKSIVVKKPVSIQGSGMALTILFRPEEISDSILSSDSSNCMFKCTINVTSSSRLSFSDFSLKSKVPCVVIGDGGSLAPDIGIRLTGCTDFLITRCHFENFGYAAISVVHEDDVSRGLISKNEFYHNVKGPDGLSLGYGIVICGSNKQWMSNPQFGTNNFIFAEDNTFDFHRHAIAAGGCARYVFRYNTIINNNIGPHSGQAIDAHEARQIAGPNYYSARAVEIYNNKVSNSTFTDGTSINTGLSAKSLVETAILIRGGEALVHDNDISGYRFAVGIMNFVVQGPQAYPIFTQIGYASGSNYGTSHTGNDSSYGDGDLFAWDNNFVPYIGTDSSSAFYNYQPQYFMEERDFHLSAKPDYTPYPYPHP
jgi:hypothetical protein